MKSFHHTGRQKWNKEKKNKIHLKTKLISLFFNQMARVALFN